MSSYDPRQLRVILDDLQDYLGIWSGIATDSLKEADYTQLITREQVNQGIHYASMIKSQAEKDTLQVNSKQSEYVDILANCEEAVITAQDTLSKAQEAYQQAKQTFTYWQSELEIALAWLERATIRLEKAKREHEAAKSNYNSAKSNYDRAYQNYKRCMNDKERSNCNSEIRALDRAENDLELAVRRLENAITELNAAIEDYNQAVARVECCRQAVAYAGEAVTYATNAKTSAVNGERMAAQSVEYAKEVQKLLKLAKKKSVEQIETASEMNIVVREATEDTDQAQIHLAQADSLEESAQGYYHRANMELASRVNSLIQLNQPISLTAITRSPSKTNEQSEQKPNTVGSKRVNNDLLMRIEGGSLADFQSALQNDSTQNPSQAVRIRITDENGQKTGSYANATLEVTKQFNNTTGQYDQLDDVRMRLNDILVPENQRRNGVGSTMLDQVEQLARVSSAREIYGTLEREEARQFFTDHGYQFRGANNNELYKACTVTN